MSEALAREIRRAYDDAADAWATGPAPVYRQLAEALLGASPEPLGGQLVLDLGTGTGVASTVLAVAGARPVGIDVAEAMLHHGHAERPPGGVGDALALPFRAGGFDAVVAACSLNHLPDPASGLAECGRVTRSGGIVLASTFPPDTDHPAKAAVDTVLQRFGYEPPSWYGEFKERILARTGDADLLAGAARAAGLAGVAVERIEVDAGLDDAQLAVAWRLNMAHTAGFVTALEPRARARLFEDASAALPLPLPPAVAMLVLSARVR